MSDAITVRPIAGKRLLLTGDLDDPAQVRDTVRDWLRSNGADGFAAEATVAVADIRRGWWGGDTTGFVAEYTPDAEPVIVVYLGPNWQH